MRFTERELTIAVTETAKSVMAAQRGRRLKGREATDEVWESMAKIDRYHAMEAVGAQILPVLVALPDVTVEPGTRPTFTDAQIIEAIEPKPGDAGGRLRRKVALAGRLALVKTALGAMPERQDPDALVIPDSL